MLKSCLVDLWEVSHTDILEFGPVMRCMLKNIFGQSHAQNTISAVFRQTICVLQFFKK